MSVYDAWKIPTCYHPTQKNQCHGLALSRAATWTAGVRSLGRIHASRVPDDDKGLCAADYGGANVHVHSVDAGRLFHHDRHHLIHTQQCTAQPSQP